MKKYRYVLSVTMLLFFALIADRSFGAASTKRTEIRVPKAFREKLKDVASSLQMAQLTPIVNDKGETICMELSKIDDRDLTLILKAREKDCFSEVTVYKKVDGKVTSNKHSTISPSEVMGLYQGLLGADRVEVDVKRGKTKVPFTYIMD